MIANRRVLVTGANGFVGKAVVRRCVADGTPVVGAVRRHGSATPNDSSLIPVDEHSAQTDWSAAVRGADVVVHTAARVHVMHDTAANPLAEFRRVNVDGTLNLARQARAAGATRFVYLSSIKVNGEATPDGRTFSAGDAPAPLDTYGTSKLEAEQGLARIALETGLEVVVIRPVLVYGPAVKGNMVSLMRWLERGIPLPFAAIRNARSLVALDTLVDLIATCTIHPAGAGETFLVSDDDDLSTPELLRRTARALGCTARLFPVPPSLLRASAALVGKPDLARRLCDSLRVDIRHTRDTLGWTPKVGVDAALQQMAAHFQRNR